MVRLWPLIFCVLWVGATAQAEVREQYEALVEEHNIETEFYQKFREQEVPRAEPDEARPQERLTGQSPLIAWITGILIVLIFAGFLVLILQNAGQLRSDLQIKRQEKARQRAKRQAPNEQEVARRAAAYAARGDRLAAVEDMLAEALARAEVELDLIFGEADTARELERRLRPLWSHQDSLQKLVYSSERSQFAGETLSQDEYSACLKAYKIIMGHA